MKHPFIKSVLVLGTALALVNCSSEDTPSTTIPNQDGPQAVIPTPDANSPIVSGTSAADVIVSEPCWFLAADQLYAITTKLEVFTINGVKVGTYDPAQGTITDLNGTVMATGVDFMELPFVDPASYNLPNTTPASSASNGDAQTQPTPASSASNGGQTQPTPASSASNGGTQTTPKSSASNNNQPASSASNNNQQQGADGTCFDKVSNTYVKPYDNLRGKNNEAYAYDQSCALKCYYDPANNNCASIGTGSGSNNNNQQTQQSSASQPKSSSAVARSSSSAPKSSSSQQTQQGGNGGSGTISSNYTIKYVNGGKSGSGYATRYWDCCEPHCAWPEHGGKASTCDASGNKVAGGSQSMCDGGNAGICRGQFPMVVNDQLAFAFAATPGGENNCGKCFDLAFTGKGKYATDNHKKLIGKHLIVMSSNVGYDVAGGQFDVMIPGGGYGIFNGCGSKMGWGSQGSQYGGLLDECEKETNYTSSKYKSCLTAKCEKSFSGDAQAKEGCLFMANWMEAAGNPLLEYKEVECPKELLDRF